MVDSKSQEKGIGKKITQHRINHLKRNSEVETNRVRTSQYAYKFYGKMGFELEKIEKNYWAKNFDLYLMEMKNETKT